ncbi:N-6 DNA methylase [Streptomyces sp. H39-C1]|uniref:N-6 DNA methylase n=1 Tax=Streptomyces sp. H39-C1 TaxID=3004355 RepID=UPI0022B06281|nr:N-6 DNA methylase [Streptomyces sp. H39-C1]MCZ4103370.1 N-6 DNA methylase [Streptomyces sp. H39-C1]
MSDIAALAQVKRPVVSTWRRRHADFPAVVAESAGRPLFDGGQVTDWLTATGLGNADPTELRSETALFGIKAQARRFGAQQLVEVVGSLLCLRKLDGHPLANVVSDSDVTAADNDRELWAAVLARAGRMDAEDEFVLRELRSVDAAAAPLARLAENLVEAAYDERGAYEWLIASRSRLGLDSLAADALAPELQGLFTQLTDLGSRLEHGRSLTLADPNARVGDLLVALLREADDSERITVLAADPDERLARIVRRRLLLAGVDELALDVQTGHDLEERLADPDLIVTQLPYRPGEGRSVLAALEGVERIADLLGSGSTALVLGPADALVDALRGTEESQLRSALLRSKIVEAVIALPGGVLPYRPGYRPALWILTRDPVPSAEGKVLLADISAELLSESVRTQLAEDVLLWRAEGFRALDGHDPRYGRVVDIADLDRAFGGPLTPPAPPASAILSRTVTERPALIAEAEAHLERAEAHARSYGDEHGPYHGGILRRIGRMPRRTTLGALIAEGRVVKLQGNRLDENHLVGDGHHTVLGPEEITGGGGVGARRMDRLVLAAKYDRVALTEPADVVYTLVPRLGLYVDYEGFSVVAFPARVLRVIRGTVRPLTPRVLAALLGAARNTGRSPSAVRPARRIEEYQLPDLDPDDVERFDVLLAETERREALLRAQADALAEARRLTVAGLADGTLTLDRT